MSFKPEVIADSSGTWSSNAVRFKTRLEAESYVADLKRRWTSVSETRVVPCDEPINAVWDDNGLHHILAAP